MRKIILLAIAVTALISCEEKCWRYGFSMEITDKRAGLTVNDVPVDAGTAVNSADIRLKLFCEFNFLDTGTYSDGIEGACYIGNQGLYTAIGSIQVTCDKTIANIETGEDLLSVMNSKVYVKDQYELSVPELIAALNKGSFDSSARHQVMTGVTYEFDFAPIPYFVTVAEEDYTFTMSIHFTPYSNRPQDPFVYTFPPVRLK